MTDDGKVDMKLSLDEYLHITDMKGECDCELCESFKELVKKKLEEWDKSG